MTGGTAPAPRIVMLDGLRGAAVMGILLMNIAAFAMPFAAYSNPANFGVPGWPDLAIWGLEFVAVDGKMRAIFSALFGASLLLVTDRAERNGASAARLHFARMAILLLIGLAHACLIWEGDILVLYALVGACAFRLRSLPIEHMLIMAGLLLGLQMAILAINYQSLTALADAAAAPGATPAALRDWHALLDAIGRPSAATLSADLALHRGSWWALVGDTSAREPHAIWAQLIFDGPETLGLMLVGMVGLRTGFLTGDWRRSTYLKVVRGTYLAGMLPLAVVAVFLLRRDFPPLETAMAGDLAMPFRWVVATGHVALVAAWFARGPTALKTRISAAGRVALTNYLGTSLLMTGIFYGWGLGLYGHVGRALLLPIVFVTWLVMLWWSSWWLDRFAYGPAEYVWRLLARGKIPPFRRRAIAS